MNIQITNDFAITTGGIRFHGALIQADSYRVLGGFCKVRVQAIKNNFVVFDVDVPRNRQNLTRTAAADAGIYQGF